MKYIKVSNIKVPIEKDINFAIDKAIKKAGLNKEQIKDKKIVRHSIDARKKTDIKHVYTFMFTVNHYNKNRKDVTVVDKEISYTYNITGQEISKKPIVVVGFGPCGMFLSYLLALNGYNPVIIERGMKVEDRIKKVDDLFDNNKLDEKTNIQFGEGGAGTFSDGKLNTGIKDKSGRIKYVLETFVKFGANENILYEAKPHIGTDILIDVVKNIREEIIRLGGKFYFETALEDINIKDNRLDSIVLDNKEIIKCNNCILAIGHSARDTFEMLYNKNIKMESKPFAVGVRVMHNQSDINNALYGEYGSKMEAASYKLTYHSTNNRGVYSFCMCPGGYVVNASSKKNMMAVNGMSYSKRDSGVANSAIVVTVDKRDYNSNHPLAGMEYQNELEKKAFTLGNGKIPTQKYIEYKNNYTETLQGKIKPKIKGAYTLSNINNIFSNEINASIKEAMEYFGTKIDGFNNDDTLLCAVESRTSSPIRIDRDENMESSIKGLYPAGEGAGYAGGITSAAVDGIKIFEKLILKYRPQS